MTTEVVLVVALVVAVVFVAAGFVGRWVVRRRAAARSSLPPLFYPLLPQSPLAVPHVNGTANGKLHSNGTAHANDASSANGVTRAHTSPVASKPAFVAETPLPPPPISRVVADRPQPQPQRTVAPVGEDYRNGETVRFYRPGDQALQLLPGHLEVLEGTTLEREIRFVRVPGKPLQVMLGRDPGRLPNTVGLGSPTVSRRHARMDFADGHWHVSNLSQTNPLVVNDDEVSDTDGARPLVDGDRLQLGEVVLRFHEH